MRQRFNRNCICSSDNYRQSRKAHLNMLKDEHEAFQGSELHTAMLAVSSQEPSDNAEVVVMVFGKKTKMPYYRAKAAGFRWSWV